MQINKKLGRKLGTAVAIALMGTSFGMTSGGTAEAAWVMGSDGLYHQVSEPTETAPKSTPATNKTTAEKMADATKVLVDSKTTTPALSTNSIKTNTGTPAKNNNTSTVKTSTNEGGVLTKVAVKEPTGITQVTLSARDKKYLNNVAKFPIQKVGTTKTFSNKVSSGSIQYFKNAVRITEVFNKNNIPKNLTYINMANVKLTSADIKNVVSNKKELMKALDDTYSKAEQDYSITHAILHVWYNGKDRVSVDLEIPNDTYVQQKTKVNNDLRSKLKSLDKQRNEAITTAASALAKTKTIKAESASIMDKEYYPEWKNTTEPLRIEKEGIEANLSYLNTQMTSLNSQQKSLQTKKTAADTKVKNLQTQKATADKKLKTLQTQKSKAKTTAEKNNIQKQITATQNSQKSLATQITAAQKSQKSLATQISSVTAKKTSMQKNIDTTKARLKTVEAQWQKSWNKINAANTKVGTLGTNYDNARTQYLNAKKTIEGNEKQILQLNPNAVVKSWKAASVPARDF